MKKIKTTQPLKELSGSDIMMGNILLTVGKAIAEILSGSEKPDMKSYILAQKMWSEGNVSVDESDLSSIKDSIRTTKRFPNQITGQLLFILEGIKEEK